ncbi:MAG: phosphoribosylamine--glycine ligase [Myxococcota bacterium]
MRVLVIGGGGREHALCWKLAQSARVDALLAAPGNAGIAQVAECVEAPGNPAELARFAADRRIDLTVVGPEAPLCAGVADAFAERGLALFGPSRVAAEIEGSKAFAKDFLARHRIPTAAFGVFDDAAAAERFAEQRGGDVVVKADGLAAGKGVFVCHDVDEAREAVRDMLVRGALGEAGRRVVVEERLDGEEASLMALCDGEHAVALDAAQDHKRALDGDRGPNTGGMGAYSPTPALPPDLARHAMETVIFPTLRGLSEEGRTFRGLLYAGLMIVRGEPIVLEFNCRFGDPETQAVVPRIDEDLAPLLEACARGRLARRAIAFRPGSAVTVVLAAAGYPGAYAKGAPIDGLDFAAAEPDAVVFHAGTRREGDRVVTAGGRVLGVTGLGADVEAARERAYAAVAAIHFDGMHYRRDIAARALGGRG